MNRCFKKKKFCRILCLAVIAARIFGIVLFYLRSPKETSCLGSWYSPDTPPISLEVSQTDLLINGIRLPWEKVFPMVDSPCRKTPQNFILNGGPMGVLSGSFFIEDQNLFLTIDGDEKKFIR